MKLARRRLARRKRGLWPDFESEWSDDLGLVPPFKKAERRFQRRSATTRGAAYHEAGHLVANLIEYDQDEIWGARVGMVRTTDNERMGGGSMYTNPGSFQITTRHRLQELVCSMAGVMAEGYAVSATSDVLLYGSKGDHDYQGRLYAAQRNMNASLLYYERAYLRADGIVRRHWPLIRRVAERLYRDGSVGINRPVSLAWTRPLVGSKKVR
jgi:hypothetical protein